MKFDQIFQMFLGLAAPFIPLGAVHVHKIVQGWFTVPKDQRSKLFSGMSGADKAEAERLQVVAADAMSDYVVFVASRGKIDPD